MELKKKKEIIRNEEKKKLSGASSLLERAKNEKSSFLDSESVVTALEYLKKPLFIIDEFHSMFSSSKNKAK